MPFQVVTCYFFVEAFIIISYVISHCICSMYHVLTRSITYVTFISVSCYPPSDTGGTNACTWHLLCLSYFSFTNKSIIVHWQTNGTDCHICYSMLRKHELRGTCTTFAFIQKNNYFIAHITGYVHLYMTLMCVTELWLWLCMTFITTWTLLIFHIFTYVCVCVSYKVILISLTTMTTVIVITFLKK